MISEVGGESPWGALEEKGPKCLKGPKNNITYIKQAKLKMAACWQCCRCRFLNFLMQFLNEDFFLNKNYFFQFLNNEVESSMVMVISPFDPKVRS